MAVFRGNNVVTKPFKQDERNQRVKDGNQKRWTQSIMWRSLVTPL